MLPSAPPNLARQLARVRRRLFLETFLQTLVWCLAAALLAGAVWCLVQPLLLETPPDWLRWGVAGGLVGAGFFAAIGLAVWRQADELTAALSLDEKFGLRERVTTSLTLSPDAQASPAGQALLADVEQRLAGLDVASRFPLRLRWNAVLVPACAAALVLAAFFFDDHMKGHAGQKPSDELAQEPVQSPQLDEKLKKLEKKAQPKQDEAAQKGEKLKQFEDDLDKLAVKPRGNKQEVKDLLKEATALEDQMAAHRQMLAERKQALRDQLRQMDRLGQQDKQDGPAKDLQKALDQGRLDDAKEEIEKLAKKMQEGQLDEKEKEQLAKQVKQIKEKIEQLSRQKEEEERLEDLVRKGGPDAEELQRQLDELRKNNDKLRDSQKDLQEAAEELGKCEECMKQGKCDQAGDALRRAGKKMAKADGEAELQDVAEKLDQLRDAKKQMCECMGGKPVPGSGRRPEAKEGDTGHIDARARADFGKGQLRIDGMEKGHNLKRPRKGAEMAGEIKQAAQEAPEALERMRIPKGAGDLTRNYFDNLRGQAEQDEKDGKNP